MQVTYVTVSVIALLGAWSIATCVNSTLRGSGRLQEALGPFSTLVPRYNFFAPYPGRFDYYLVYRDRQIDGSFTAWKQADGFKLAPERFGWLWNPCYYRTKVLCDFIEPLKSEFVEDESEAGGTLLEPDATDGQLIPVEHGSLEMSLQYLALLDYVSSQTHSEQGEATQFAVMQGSRALEEYEPVLLSKFHRL